MSKAPVLIDSSAWITHLKERDHEISQTVERLLIPEGRAAINAIIRLEVLTGALDERQYVALEDQFLGLPNLPLVEPVWRLAERTRFALRKRGVAVSVPDVLIASSAIVYDCELLHADHHFELIAKHTPLKIHHYAVR